MGRDNTRSQRHHYPYKTPQSKGDDNNKSNPCRTIFCGNLSYETTWQTLKDHMRQAGEVTRADVLMDRVTGRSKGCGIVEYEDAADARKALRELHESQLDGRQIFLREDREEASDGRDAPPSLDRPLSATRLGRESRGVVSTTRVYVGNLGWGTFNP